MNLLLTENAKSFLSDPMNMLYYLGTENLNLILSSLFFGYIGVIILLLIDISTRNPLTTYSPVPFSFKYLLKDNGIRFVLNMILVFVFIRFLPEFINKPINQFNGLLIGLCSDMLAMQIKKSKNKFFAADTAIKKNDVTDVVEDKNETENTANGDNADTAANPA